MSSFSFPLFAAGGESAAHHRHLVSLEQILDFAAAPLTAAQQREAETTFNQLISHAESLQGTSPYKKATLVHLTYEHSRSKDTFLQQFFLFVDGDNIDDDNTTQDLELQPSFEQGLMRFHGFTSQTAPASLKREAEGAIDSFAEHLFQHFFLPMKAAGAKTQQPSRASSTGPALENVIGSSARLSTLRRDCLIRDHHRCVVTRVFDGSEAISRAEKDPMNVKDDEGHPLDSSLDVFDELEVAHIIPHSIMSAKSDDGTLQLSKSKMTALSILNMFEPGVVRLIEGPNIDRPFNAISLAPHVHKNFGLFRITFEALHGDPSQLNHTYKIQAPRPFISNMFKLPVARTLFLSPNHTIDPPSPKLLALHHAIGTILELSAAGGYIDRIIHHMEEVAVRSDGSAELGRIVTLRMGGWLDGVV
ncbi:hypothetical protein FQN53_009783 [Emmonsiellopsis sp. PD_33]|nr:hypothetical protein FQN53_009783 [Emmonsiellopsis sp. PD_33]